MQYKRNDSEFCTLFTPDQRLMSRVLTSEEISNYNFTMLQNNRLTKDSAAVAKLIEKFEKGEIKGTEDPKSVFLSDPLFQQHKLANFRTFYHNTRAKFGNNQSESKFNTVPLILFEKLTLLNF